MTRTTHTSLDVWQEKTYQRLLEHRCGSKLIRFVDRIHEVHVNEKSPKGYRWSRERFTKIQATTRPDFLWPEIRIGMSKAATKKQKQEWTRNQSLITLERKMEAAMPCKMDTRKRARKPQETAASECTDSHKKTMYACNWRIFQSLLTNCIDMLVCGTNRKTRLSVVGQQTCKSSHKMDSGL